MVPVNIRYSHNRLGDRTVPMLTRMQQLALKPDGEMSIGTQHWGVVNGKLKTWCSYQIYNNTAKTYTVVDELTSSKTTYPIGIDADQPSSHPRRVRAKQRNRSSGLRL